MSSPAEITVGNGTPNSISVASTDGNTIVVSPSGGTSVSVDSPGSQSISISSSSTEVVVQSPSIDPISIDTTAINIEVSSNLNIVDAPRRLRELLDVVGDPESNQVLVYNQGDNNFQFADQIGAGGDGDTTLEYAITVTNDDEAFDTIISTVYEAGTSLTDVLKAILDPYQKTSVSLSSMSGTLNGSDLNIGVGTKVVEVGSQVNLSRVSYGVPEPDKIKDTSLKLLQNGSSHMTLNETGTSDVTLTPHINSMFTTPHTDTYVVTAIDNGNPNGAEYTTTSSSIKVEWRYFVVLAADTSIPTTNEEATAIFGGSSTDGSLINDPGSSSFDLVCGEENAADGYYTFLMWPSTFGTLKSVLQNSSTDTTADFTLVGEFTVTNSYDLGIAYYIYRTNDTGAFNDEIVLTVKLN